jgi:hypothetical protein
VWRRRRNILVGGRARIRFDEIPPIDALVFEQPPLLARGDYSPQLFDEKEHLLAVELEVATHERDHGQ